LQTTAREAVTFPESQRVIYERNPLEEVICQFRFPPILRIDSEIPARFQEAIRREYPLFSEQKGEELVATALPKEITRLIEKDFPIRIGNPTFLFTSEDGTWKVSLTREFLALTTLQYERWEDFRTHLERPFNALVKEYSPSFFSRIGLRYRDVIRRSRLGLEDSKWGELLEDHIGGTLALTGFSGAVTRADNNLLISLEEDNQVRIRHGLARSNGNGETCYVIDSDFYAERKTESAHAIEQLDKFNRQAGHLFRWCITKKLHRAMGPRPA
jgi:uncharacterized protein (TIGR04255 family)